MTRGGNGFRRTKQWGEDGNDQRHFRRNDRKWKVGSDPGGIHDGKRYEDRGSHIDQGGWQQVQRRRTSRHGDWRGGRNMDIAARRNTLIDEKMKIVSFYFSNFPARYNARDMYDIFSIQGRVVEVVILGRRDARRKRFGFVRFQNVRDPENLAVKLDNIHVEGVKIHVNLPRFSRNHGEHPKKETNHHKEEIAPNGKATTQKVWVQKQPKVQSLLGGSYKEAVLCGIDSEKVISYRVGDDTVQNLSVGEVLWPGKTYYMQDEFIRQGVFSIKATPMGANLVLLEGSKDEEDFMGFVEEAKEWLFQWFKWIRPWKPNDVDHERVAWVRCYGVPMHVWSSDFFTNILEHVGTYLYSDDNTEKRKSLDVACVLIRTSSTDCLNQIVRVSINNIVFHIKIVEDWCGPLQWSQTSPEVYISDSSTESESLQPEEEWSDDGGKSGEEDDG